MNHPNILTIYEIGQADSVRYIATEFIDGITPPLLYSEDVKIPHASAWKIPSHETHWRDSGFVGENTAQVALTCQGIAVASSEK